MKLVIAEKPSLAQKVVGAMGKSNGPFDKKDGYWEGRDMYVSYAFGHLFGLIDLQEYFPEGEREAHTAWRMEDLPFYPGRGRAEDYQFSLKKEVDKKTLKKKNTVDPGIRKQYEVLKKLMNSSDVDEIIHCGDADREGELIVRLILMKGLKGRKKITRLWLPDQADPTIQAQMQQLRPDDEYDNLYREGLARTIIDWMYGINLTRYVTIKCQDRSVYNIGRVLTPIVQAIYNREKEIQNFVPETYYQAESKEEVGGKEVKLTVSRKFKEGETADAQALCDKLNAADAIVTNIEKKKVTKRRPKLFSLSKLQGAAGKNLKIPMQQSLDIVQKLYEAGYVTYPRTNTEYLATAEKDRTLASIRAVMDVFPGRELKLIESKAVFDDSKIESHSALTPTVKIPQDLTGAEKSIYDMILNRFCAVFCAEDCIAEETKVEIRCGDETFTLKGEVILQEGFLRYERSKKDTFLPALNVGDKVPHHFVPAEKQTTPPKRYNTETLSAYLKKPFGSVDSDSEDDTQEYRDILKGLEIGTEATRTPTITKAIACKYISQAKDDTYHLEPKGEAMVGYLEKLRIDLDANLSVRLQVLLKDVYKGEKTIDEALAISAEELNKDFEARDERLKTSASSSGAASFGGGANVLGQCPHCGGNVISGKYGAYCTNKCGMSLGRAMGKTLTDNQVKSLLTGKSITLRGLTSKSGKTYDAMLIPKGVKEYSYTSRTGERKEGFEFEFNLEFPSSGKTRKKN